MTASTALLAMISSLVAVAKTASMAAAGKIDSPEGVATIVSMAPAATIASLVAPAKTASMEAVAKTASPEALATIVSMAGPATISSLVVAAKTASGEGEDATLSAFNAAPVTPSSKTFPTVQIGSSSAQDAAV